MRDIKNYGVQVENCEVQKACDSWLDEIMGTPTVHEDSHLVMINAFENTKGLSGANSHSSLVIINGKFILVLLCFITGGKAGANSPRPFRRELSMGCGCFDPGVADNGAISIQLSG